MVIILILDNYVKVLVLSLKEYLATPIYIIT
jgi:hypothetical protein